MSRRSSSYRSIDIFHPEVTDKERDCLRSYRFQTRGDWMYDFVRDVCVVHGLKCSAVFKQNGYPHHYSSVAVSLADSYGNNVYLIHVTTGKGNDRSLYNTLTVSRYHTRGSTAGGLVNSSQRAYLTKTIKINLENDKLASNAHVIAQFLESVGHSVLTDSQYGQNNGRTKIATANDRAAFTLQGDAYISLMDAVLNNMPIPQSVIEHLTVAKGKYDKILSESSEYSELARDLLSGEKWIVSYNYLTGYQVFSVDLTDFGKKDYPEWTRHTAVLTNDMVKFHGFTRDIDTLPTEVSESLKAAYTMHAIQVANTDQKNEVYPAPSLLPLNWDRVNNTHGHVNFSVPWNIANPRPVIEANVNLCSATAHYSSNAPETQWLMINKI